MSDDKQFEKTIYRKWSNGEIIALFPQIAVDETGYYCQSYIHVGQHGGADPYIVVKQTKLATPFEYEDLDDELRGLDGCVYFGTAHCYKEYHAVEILGQIKEIIVKSVGD